MLLGLELDLIQGFLLPLLARSAIFLLLAAALPWRLLRRPRHEPDVLRRLLNLGLILAFFLAGLGLVGQIASWRVRTNWSAGENARLVTQEREIRVEFTRFSSHLARVPLPWTGAGPDADRGLRFRRLRGLVASVPESPGRYGWTLWRGSVPDAWAGRTTASVPPQEDPEAAGFRVVQRGAAFVLLSTKWLPGGYVLQGEYLFQSPLENQPQIPLPALEEALRGDRVSLRLLPTPEFAPTDLPDFDPRTGDNRREEPAAGSVAVSFPLREPGGRPLAVVRIQDTREDRVREKVIHGCQAAGLCVSLLLLLTGASVAFRSARTSSRFSGICFLLGSGLLWSARLLLSGFHELLNALPLFDPGRFASLVAWGLLKSPADFFLTALFLALNAFCWDRWISVRNLPPGVRRRLAWLQAAALLALAASAFLVAWETPRHARFEVLKLEFSPSDWAKLLVQAGLFLFFAALLAAAVTVRRLLTSHGQTAVPRAPSALPAAARWYGFVALATLLYLPVVDLSTIRQREHFFSGSLLNRLEQQQRERRDSLKGVLRAIHDSSEIGEVLGRYGAGSGEGLAYEVWAATRLDEIGLSSSLRVFSEDGRLLGRFGLNLPSRLEARFPPSGDEGSIRGSLRPLGMSRVRVLVGEASRTTPSGETLRFQVHLLDEYDNLPFLRADNLYMQLFPRPRTQETNPELLGSEPLVAAYDPSGRILYSSLEAGPDPPVAAAALAVGDSLWTSLRSGEDRYRVLFRRNPDRLLALGFLLPSRLEQVGAFLRTTLLGILLAGGLALLLRISTGPGSPSPVRQGPFFKRLLVMILAASLVPLLLFSFFLHRFVVREINEDIRAEGLASLRAARRIVEDYLATQRGPREVEVDDDVAFWLSRVVKQDINLYSGDRLSATSAREIYASGLLPTRLDSRVYERLILAGAPFVLNDERLGALKYQTISAPMTLGDGSPGILSLPLAEKRQEIVRKRADVEEAILIVTVGMLLLLTVLSHSLARRVSEPVVALAKAARRIETGDFEAEVRVPARDEPALLIESFNRMAASLRRQREDLRRRSDYIEKILLNATTGVISLNPSGRLVTVNPAARILLGLPGAGLEGEDFSALLGGFEALAPLRLALDGSGPEGEKTWQIPLAGAGTPSSLRVVSLPFREALDSPIGRILLLEDLTETVRSSRLEAWAEMARRIAHEIKNPLTPIQLSADHLRKVYRSGDPRFGSILEECLDTIQKQVQNLRSIAAEFSDYSRIPPLRPERVPAAEMLDEVLRPYRAALPGGIRLESSVRPGTPDLFVDRALTCRALLNVIQNALEAMPQGGLLSVIAERGPRPPDGGPGGVRILVSDTGAGMDSRTLSRLFEPYFSTKESGTGLGLSIVRKTVEEQGGGLEVTSSPGSGTKIILDLPALPGDERPEPRELRSGTGTGQPGGPATV